MPTVVVDNFQVDYTDAGTGLPLVFVSGLFGSPEWFRYQSSGLSDRYRVIACSLPTARGRAECSLDILAEVIARFLGRLRVHSAVIAGHTLGALVAIKFAAAHPDRTLALALVSAIPSFVGIGEAEILEHLSPGEVEQDSPLARLWRRLTGAKRTVRDSETDPLAQLSQSGLIDRGTLNARMSMLKSADVTSVLPEVETPALIIAGSGDWSRVLTGSQLLDYTLPSASLEVLEEAGHFCFYTRHDIFNAILDDFISHEVPRL